MTWKALTKEQKAHLIKSVWRDGITSTQIGMAVGATKGSIVGFYYHHRDMLEDCPLPKSVAEKNRTGDYTQATIIRHRQLEAKAERERRSRIASLVTSFKTPEFEAADIPSTDDGGLYVTMADNVGCKWPLNDGGPYVFCGHDRLGKYSYCARHQDRSVGRGTEGERRALSVSARHVSG